MKISYTTDRDVTAGRGTEIREVQPELLDCGCEFTPGRVVIGYNPHYTGRGRARTYYCPQHRVMTYDEPDVVR